MRRGEIIEGKKGYIFQCHSARSLSVMSEGGEGDSLDFDDDDDDLYGDLPTNADSIQADMPSEGGEAMMGSEKGEVEDGFASIDRGATAGASVKSSSTSSAKVKQLGAEDLLPPSFVPSTSEKNGVTFESLEKENQILKTNISKLWRTAKAETLRKDKEIERLKRELREAREEIGASKRKKGDGKP